MKPWYYTIGYPVKVFKSGVWAEGMICDAFRHRDDDVSVLTMEGIVVLYGDSLKEGLLKPNIPDDNPWITTPPKSSEWGKVYMTVVPYNAPIVIRGSIEGGKFHFANGRRVKERVTAWKYIRYPEPYKEVSEE